MNIYTQYFAYTFAFSDLIFHYVKIIYIATINRLTVKYENNV